MTNKRVLFIQAYDRASPESFLSVPLGIHRVGFYAEAKVPGVSCDFFDPNLVHQPGSDPKDPTVFNRAIDVMKNGMDGKGPYDVIAFSPLHFTLEYDLAMMYNAQKHSPQSLFVAGGQHANFAPKQMYQHWSGLNAVIRGEGERPFAQIMQIINDVGVENVRKYPNILENVSGLTLPDGTNTGSNPPMNAEEFIETTMALDFGPRMKSKEYWSWIEQNYTAEELQDIKLLRKIRVVKPYTTNYCPMACSFCST